MFVGVFNNLLYNKISRGGDAMIYDVNTKNISFLKVSSHLRKVGVKNNKFMLALIDESLIGVDPHSKELTEAQKIAIYREIAINKWYYIREVVRVPVDGVIEGISYRLNLGNLTLSYLKTKNINQVVILPRQHGKTIGQIIDDSWTMLFAGTNTNIIYSNKEFKDSKKNLKLFKDIRDRLPRFLVEFVSNGKSDKDNEEYKLVANRNNTLKAMAAANSDDGADKLGRGMTTSNIYFDEFAFLTRNRIIFEAALPAWSTASENAKKAGTPYSIVITTTPNNVDTPHGAYAKMIVDKAAKFEYICFDMDDKEIDEFVQKNSSNNFVFVQYSYKELGRNDDWLKEQIRNFQGDLGKVKRELLLDWPKSTDFSIFNEEQLEKLYVHIKQPLTSLNINGYFIQFYEQPDLNTNYIVSCDIAGGLSQDNTAILLIAPDDFRVVGDFRNNKIDTDNSRKLIERIMKDFFRNAILIIERNSYGLNLLQYFMKDRVIEQRMVQEEKEHLGEKTQKDGFTVKKKTKNIVYGIDTNQRTRKLMFELLPEIVENEYDKIVSPRLYEDIAGLERKKNGKVEHSNTTHDDTLMAYLIFRYALHYGKSMKDRFKINAIPTQSNIKVVSSERDIERIEKLLTIVQAPEAMGMNNNDVYNFLVDQSSKIREKDDKMRAFEKIIDLNKN
jgi:hypothetical protein